MNPKKKNLLSIFLPKKRNRKKGTEKKAPKKRHRKKGTEMIKKYSAKLMGAGILPVSLHKNNLYFLFGLEEKEKKWSDFGGSKEDNESKMETAVREGYEELNGFLGNKTEIKKTVNDNFILRLNTEHNKFSTHIFKSKYDENLPFYFENVHKFIQKKIPQHVGRGGLFEKSKVRWFTIEEIKSQRAKFRYFYRQILDQIIDNQKIIFDRVKNL